MEYLGAWGTLIHEKKLRSKISCQTPFKGTVLRYLTYYLVLSVKLDNYFSMWAYVWSILLACCRNI